MVGTFIIGATVKGFVGVEDGASLGAICGGLFTLGATEGLMLVGSVVGTLAGI